MNFGSKLAEAGTLRMSEDYRMINLDHKPANYRDQDINLLSLGTLIRRRVSSLTDANTVQKLANKGKKKYIVRV